MRSFELDMLPGRVVFGAGAWARLPDELARLGAERVLVVSSAGRRALAEELRARLGARCVGLLAEARAHVPIEQAEAARARTRALGADCVVGVGGGTPIGLAKAIAFEVEVKLAAAPTTYSGSEMTAIVGITRDGVKRAVSDRRLLPQLVVYDPALTTGLPANATACTGMNALAHCVEALYARSPNPLANLMAEAGIRALAAGLPKAVAVPADIDARADALYGAYLAGAALASVGIALHHKICHVLGGSYGLGHGEANAVMLPHVVRYNEPAAAPAIAAVAHALGAEDAASALFDFARQIGAPTSLEQLGLDEGALDAIARRALEMTDYNPRALDFDGIRALLDNAYHGRRP